MAHIIKETPSGIIDGENKIFTFSYEIKIFDDLWLDWAIYSDFSIDWKNIILADAPKSSIFWDYYSFDNESWTKTKYISKEKPEWIIDWNNKTFVLKKDVYRIIDLWLDGVIYKSFSIDWRILTLLDAPRWSLFVNYYWVFVSRRVDTGVTFGRIKEEVWRLIWQKNTSKNFWDDYLSSKINTVAYDIWNWYVTNLLNPNDIIKSLDLYFQNDNYPFRINSGSILWENISLWTIEFKIWLNNMSERWWAILGSDVLEYSKNIDCNLKWVLGVNINHNAWERIEQLYEVPEDFSKLIGIKKIIKDSTWVKELEIPFDSWKISFSIINESRTWKKLLKINSLNDGDEMKIVYVREYPRMFNDTDLSPFPWEYWLSVLAILTAWIIAQENAMPMANTLLSVAYPNLRTMYSYFSSQIKSNNQKIMPKPYFFNTMK